VAEETTTNARVARFAAPALVDGRVGLVVAPRGRLLAAIALTIKDEKITEVDAVADPLRPRRLDPAVPAG
jgi:hypothetical protein